MVETEGIEPSSPRCGRGIFPLDDVPVRAHGRNRTCGLRDVGPAIWPLIYARLAVPTGIEPAWLG